jgi:1,6-anhydro-N-acetylmuramate kinase
MIGLMSGTSTDGITAAAARFAPSGAAGVTFELLGWRARSYLTEERERLLRAIDGATPAEYTALDFALGGWLADAVHSMLTATGLDRGDVRAIAPLATLGTATRARQIGAPSVAERRHQRGSDPGARRCPRGAGAPQVIASAALPAMVACPTEPWWHRT